MTWTDAEKAERYWLWCNHGCFIAFLYGDDGEMQCNATLLHRPLDFKREELVELRIATVNALKAQIEQLTTQLESVKKPTDAAFPYAALLGALADDTIGENQDD